MSDQRLVEEAVSAVEKLCEPERMSPEEAIDFLEDVVSRLQSSIEALKEENDTDC